MYSIAIEKSGKDTNIILHISYNNVGNKEAMILYNALMNTKGCFLIDLGNNNIDKETSNDLGI